MICKEPARHVFDKNGYAIFECYSCDHRMAHVDNVESHTSRIYSDAYFFEGGSGYPNYLEERDPLIAHGRRYGRILKKVVSKTGTVLDVGTAAGFLMRGMAEEGWEVFGIEPNDTMAGYARRELGLKVETGTIESFNSERKFKVISFVQVIAHLLDPKEAMLKAKSLLEPGGFILIETWNWQSLTARVFGKNWHEYSPPSVIHWFSKKSLNALMDHLGLEIVALGRPKKKISWGHARSLLLSETRLAYTRSAIRFVNHFLPGEILIPYPSLDLFWAIYRR